MAPKILFAGLNESITGVHTHEIAVPIISAHVIYELLDLIWRALEVEFRIGDILPGARIRVARYLSALDR
jgi:hypothetical protein